MPLWWLRANPVAAPLHSTDQHLLLLIQFWRQTKMAQDIHGRQHKQGRETSTNTNTRKSYKPSYKCTSVKLLYGDAHA